MEFVELINTMNALNEVKDTTGKKDKEALIDKYKDNTLFVYILEFLCNTDKNTGIAIKKLNKDVTLKTDQFSVKIASVENLIEFVLNNPTGNDMVIKSVQDSINCFPEETHDFLKQLITKKYKCGVTAKTLNKVIPGTVEEFNVMLAEKYKDHKKLLDGKTEFVVTVKLDGVRVVLQKEQDLILFKTRQGKKITGLVELEEEAKLLPDGVYDGELIATGTFAKSQDMYKETMKRFAIKDDKTGLKMICFDYIKDRKDFLNGYDDTSFIKRKENLRNILETLDEEEGRIEQKYNYFLYHDNVYVGTDINEVSEIFKTAISMGEEGLMINIANAPYEAKRTKNLLKYKEFNTADVLITNIIEGTGKHTGMLGSVTAECLIDIDGKEHHCISDVGSGFTDEQRKMYWDKPELILNKIAEIEYFEITTNEKGTYSLRFATWKDRIRIDKSTTHVD